MLTLPLCDEILLNVFSNFIPNKIKTFTDRNPTLVTYDIKNKIKLKNKFYRQYMRHQRQISGLLKIEDLFPMVKKCLSSYSRCLFITNPIVTDFEKKANVFYSSL